MALRFTPSKVISLWAAWLYRGDKYRCIEKTIMFLLPCCFEFMVCFVTYDTMGILADQSVR